MAPDVVEIDELKSGRRKYHCGCRQEDHCVFGGVEKWTCNAFMVEFQDRSAATLLPIIQKHVLPGIGWYIQQYCQMSGRLTDRLSH